MMRPEYLRFCYISYPASSTYHPFHNAKKERCVDEFKVTLADIRHF